MAKINWNKIEIEYITTKTSYGKLAKKHKISKSAVEKYGIEHNWVQKRRQYCSEVVAKSLARAGERDVEKLITVGKSAEKMVSVIEKIFDDEKQFRRQIITVTDKDGNLQQKEKMMKKYDTKAVRDVTSALREIVATIRDVYEIYPEPIRQKMDIESERLQLMKDKVHPTNEDGEESGVIEIAGMIEPPPEEEDSEQSMDTTT